MSVASVPEISQSGNPRSVAKTHGNLCKANPIRRAIFIIWKNMQSRCRLNPHYEGVSVCRMWVESFDAFYEWSIKNGYQPNMEIDRKDGTLGYTPENCRWVTHQQNNWNTRKKSNATGSRFKGVYVGRNGIRWQSTIRMNGARKYLGTFDTEEQAALAYDVAAREAFGEYAKTNGFA